MSSDSILLIGSNKYALNFIWKKSTIIISHIIYVNYDQI